MTHNRTAGPAPLRAPYVSRMEELERQLGADMARTAELWAAVEATRDPWLEAEECLDRHGLEANPDPALWRQLKAEVERTRTASRLPSTPGARPRRPSTRRVEWLQLQIVRGFLPHCALWLTPSPRLFRAGRDERPPALCLDCLDT